MDAATIVFLVIDSLVTLGLAIALDRVLAERRRLRDALARERATRVMLGLPIHVLTPNDLLRLVDANRPMGRSLRHALDDMRQTLDAGRYP